MANDRLGVFEATDMLIKFIEKESVIRDVSLEGLTVENYKSFVLDKFGLSTYNAVVSFVDEYASQRGKKGSPRYDESKISIEKRVFQYFESRNLIV